MRVTWRRAGGAQADLLTAALFNVLLLYKAQRAAGSCYDDIRRRPAEKIHLITLCWGLTQHSGCSVSIKVQLWNPNGFVHDLTHSWDWKHMSSEWGGGWRCTVQAHMEIFCLLGLQSEVHVKTCCDTYCFLITLLKPSGRGSSGRRRKRSDWSCFQCPPNPKVRVNFSSFAAVKVHLLEYLKVQCVRFMGLY